MAKANAGRTNTSGPLRFRFHTAPHVWDIVGFVFVFVVVVIVGGWPFRCECVRAEQESQTRRATLCTRTLRLVLSHPHG